MSIELSLGIGITETPMDRRAGGPGAGADNLLRGNILVWEQELAARVVSSPLSIDARMETQSILYRTIALFASTFVVVAILFVMIIWWVVRRGAKPAKS